MIKNNFYKILLAILILLASHNSFALASEVSGTLSTGFQSQPEIITDSNPNGNEVFFTVVDEKVSNWEVPVIIKIILVGGVALEIIFLIVINFIKRRKRIYQ